MDKQNWYFEQLVKQAQMDTAFDRVEAADLNQHVDSGFVGINNGLSITSNGNQTVTVTTGTAYDPTGQRIRVGSNQVIDCTVDYQNNPTTIAVGGNEKWLSVFAVFDRNLTTPAVDGNGVSLSYDLLESFVIEVYQEAEAAPGTAAVYTATANQNYALADGQTLDISVNGTTPQTVTFNTASFADIANATAAEVAAVIDLQTSGIVSSVSGSAVRMTSVATGSLASLYVTGGSAAAVFAFPSTASTGAGGPSRPALRADAVLLGDILLREGSTVIQDPPDGSDSVIDLVSRREWMFIYESDEYDIKVGTVEEFMGAVGNVVNSHITNAGNAHPATAITYDPTALPINGNSGGKWTALKTAGTVQEAIDAFEDILAPQDVGTDSGSESLTFRTLADGSVTAGRGTPIWALNTGTGHGKSWTDLQADMIEAFANRLENDTVSGDWNFTGATTFTGTTTVNGNMDVNADINMAGGTITGPVEGTGTWNWDSNFNVNTMYLWETASSGNDGGGNNTFFRYEDRQSLSAGSTDIGLATVGTHVLIQSVCIAEVFVVATPDDGSNTGFHYAAKYRFNVNNTQIANMSLLGTADSNDFTGGNVTVDFITPSNFTTSLECRVTVAGLVDYNVGVHLRLTSITYV